jgi:glutamate-1-semialdehyde 2,1-aminomutase
MRDRANNAIAQGCLTNSKSPESLMFGLYPTHIKAAFGAHVWDHKDQRWLDFICGLGCNLLGYGNDQVARAIISQVYNGASHSLPTVHEVETAEALKSIFPFVDLFKFTKTGSLACDAALRIARTYTGRYGVLSEGYHGHSDDFVSMSPPAKGVPQRGWMKHLSPDLSDIDDGIAAVIVEPVQVDDSLERIKWLGRLRKKCDLYGVVLIFDEIITGFRYKKYSVSNCYGVLPDLICLGKAMANGMPLAAVGGKRELMNGDYFISSTYAGDTLSLVACQATIKTMFSNSDFNHDHLWKLGQAWQDKFNANDAGLSIKGYPTRGVFEGDPKKIAMYFQEMGRANMLFCKSWFFNWALAEHTDNVMQISEEAMFRIAKGEVKLKYPMPKTPYAQSVRG